MLKPTTMITALLLCHYAASTTKPSEKPTEVKPTTNATDNGSELAAEVFPPTATPLVHVKLNSTIPRDRLMPLIQLEPQLELNRDICSLEGELCERPGDPWMACCPELGCMKEITRAPFTLSGVDRKFIWGRCYPFYSQEKN